MNVLTFSTITGSCVSPTRNNQENPSFQTEKFYSKLKAIKPKCDYHERKSWIRRKCTICLWCCIFWQSQKNPTSPCNQVSWTSRLCKGSKLWPSGQTCCRWVPLSRLQGDTESSCPELALWIPSICIWHGRGFHWSKSRTHVEFCLCWLKQRTFRISSPNGLLWKEN